MDWAGKVSEAIGYIEEHLLEELTIDDIAGKVFISPFYFQKGFCDAVRADGRGIHP